MPSNAQQLRDELRASGMPHDTSVTVNPNGTVTVDWDDPRRDEIISAHEPDVRHAWPTWKRELHDLLTEAEHRTLSPDEMTKVDKHMKTLARHSLDNEARQP